MKKLSVSLSLGVMLALVFAPLWTGTNSVPGVCDNVSPKYERTPGFCYLIKGQV